MHPSAGAQSEQLLARLVHDLRQPISNIGLSISYLGLVLEPGESRVREQVQLIQEQVDRASDMLTEVAVELGRMRSAQLSESEAAPTAVPEPAVAS